MRWPLLVALLTLAGCRAQPEPPSSRRPLRLDPQACAVRRAEELARRGRTGQALQVLRRIPEQEIGLGCLGISRETKRRLELEQRLLHGPLELSSTLVELEPPSAPGAIPWRER